MEKTQTQQLKAAKRAYIFNLTPNAKGMTSRFSIYLDDGNGLEILWPNYDERGGSGKRDLLPDQVYSNRRTLPAYHFSLNGYGYSKEDTLRRMLQEVNPDIEVHSLSGYSPSLVL